MRTATLHKGALSANIDITNGCVSTKFTINTKKKNIFLKQTSSSAIKSSIANVLCLVSES